MPIGLSACLAFSVFGALRGHDGDDRMCVVSSDNCRCRVPYGMAVFSCKIFLSKLQLFTYHIKSFALCMKY